MGSSVRYIEHKDFRKSLAGMRLIGGQPKKRADKVYAVLGRICTEIDDPFHDLPLTNHGESRIEKCRKFDLGDGYRLVTVLDSGLHLLCFAGNHEECEAWIRAHSGMRLSVDKNHSWSVVYKSGLEPGAQIRRDPSPARGHILERLSSDLQDSLLDGLQPKLIRKLYELDESATDNDIAELCERIPDPLRAALVYDVVCLLLCGDIASAEGRVDLEKGRIRVAADLGAPELLEIRDGDTIRRVVIGSEEHAKLLEQLARDLPHYDWLLFMHPEQQTAVDADFDGPAQLSGVSGSGKTCVAVRRAIRLAEQNPTARVLVITLNRSLASLIDQLIAQTAPAAVQPAIKVTSFFELCQDLLATLEPGNTRLYRDVTWKLEEHLDEVFREFYRRWNNNDEAKVLLPIHRSLTARNVSGEAYIREEFDWIRSAVVDDRESYLAIDRAGRKFPLLPDWRQLILEGLGAWERKMTAIGVIDYLGLTVAVSRHLEKLRPLYHHVIVDEAQDFGTAELAIIRRLVAPGPNDILLCGDIAQHVLPKRRSLSEAGIQISGRTRRIRRNYRNSREILSAAYDVLIENLDEALIESSDLELLDPELASRSSPQPGVLEAPSLAHEIAFARALIEDHRGFRSRDHCCIAIAGFSLREVELYSRRLGLPVLNGASEPNASPVVLSDLEQTKGYEFNVMVVVNCRDGVLPPNDGPQEEAFRYGCQLYVAMTRARDELYLSYSGTPSRWLTKTNDRLAFMSWSDVVRFDESLLCDPPLKLVECEDDVGMLDGTAFGYTSHALGLSMEAQHRLCELVDGIGLIRDRRQIRWRNVADLARDFEKSPTARAAFGPKVWLEVRDALGMAAKRTAAEKRVSVAAERGAGETAVSRKKRTVRVRQNPHGRSLRSYFMGLSRGMPGNEESDP